LTKNCEQNFLGGGKSKISRSLEVLSSQTGIPKGPKKFEILEGRGVKFWKMGGMGVEHFGISEGFKMFMPSMVRYMDIIWNHPMSSIFASLK